MNLKNLISFYTQAEILQNDKHFRTNLLLQSFGDSKNTWEVCEKNLQEQLEPNCVEKTILLYDWNKEEYLHVLKKFILKTQNNIYLLEDLTKITNNFKTSNFNKSSSEIRASRLSLEDKMFLDKAKNFKDLEERFEFIYNFIVKQL